ncbi:MAG: prephenate dehydrogenase/arogenate dehydrogenase family protein [Actinomycetota bacterium]
MADITSTHHDLDTGPRSVGVVGTGLIGGSIGLGLRKAGWLVTAFDPDPDVRAIAEDRSVADTVVGSLETLTNTSLDLLVVAAPPKATIEIISNLATSIPTMDVAGVKEPVVAAAPSGLRFVPTHPMAGREISGPRAATASLFSGAAWVVVDSDTDADAVDVASAAITDLGARIITMSAADHDRAVAAVSHLPHIVAGALLSGASDTPEALELSAGSFRDLTRVGASMPIPWVEILKTNRGPMLDAIGLLRDRLSEIESAIVSRDDSLLRMLSEARDTRRSLGAQAVQVRVALADEPGELAKVGHAFENSSADIRDIQMRHAPYGGGGVLSVSVRPGEESALRAALAEVGLLVVD